MNIVVREIVIASRDRSSTGGADSILKEQDVCFLVADDELQVIEILVGEPGCNKVRLAEARQGSFVEDVFQMFELKRAFRSAWCMVERGKYILTVNANWRTSRSVTSCCLFSSGADSTDEAERAARREKVGSFMIKLLGWW